MKKWFRRAGVLPVFGTFIGMFIYVGITEGMLESVALFVVVCIFVLFAYLAAVAITDWNKD